MQPDLLIVGAGPAGLSAAIEARRLGVKDILIIERESEAGGTVRHCGHLGFGMLDQARVLTGPAYAARLRARASGIPIRLNTAVTQLMPGTVTISGPDGEAALSPKRILLTTGIREKPRAARLVSGGRPFGIFTTGALQRFVYLENRLPCRNPVVIGSELVAFSTLLTLRHAGAKPVAILEEGPRLRAPFFAGPGARLFFGVPVHTGCRLQAIIGAKQVEAVEIVQHGRSREIACDGVIFSGEWQPESSVMRSHPLGIDPLTGGPKVDLDLRTGDPALFAAGNVLYGVRSSGKVALEGRHAARVIAADLQAGAKRP